MLGIEDESDGDSGRSTSLSGGELAELSWRFRGGREDSEGTDSLVEGTVEV